MARGNTRVRLLTGEDGPQSRRAKPQDPDWVSAGFLNAIVLKCFCERMRCRSRFSKGAAKDKQGATAEHSRSQVA